MAFRRRCIPAGPEVDHIDEPGSDDCHVYLSAIGRDRDVVGSVAERDLLRHRKRTHGHDVERSVDFIAEVECASRLART